MTQTFTLIASHRLHLALTDKLNDMRVLTSSQLVERYNTHVTAGLHSTAQAVELACIHHLFLRRFGDSPITIDKGFTISLGAMVSWDGANLHRISSKL